MISIKNNHTIVSHFLISVFILLVSCSEDTPVTPIEDYRKPDITTVEVTDVTETTAVARGNITDDGGAEVTKRGICWSKNEIPTINDNKLEVGTGEGSFDGQMTGLEHNTTYYVRAFATNSIGTSYGDVISFTTLLDFQQELELPTVTSNEITEITETTAKAGGNITNDGGAEIIARGVCWSTSEEPTISDNKTEDGTSSGNFNSNITGLDKATTYFVRAYATNSEGTSYGEQLSFKTKGVITGTLVDVDKNEYKTVEIGNQVWMAENLRTTKLNDGINITYAPAHVDWTAPDATTYSWYDNDSTTYSDHGLLYDYDVVRTGKVCPEGWHVPSTWEWDELINYVDGVSDAGTKLKSTSGWSAMNGTDEFEFNALPGGYRYKSGSFYSVNDEGYWWTSTGDDSKNEARARTMANSHTEVKTRYLTDASNTGCYIRCVKDK